MDENLGQLVNQYIRRYRQLINEDLYINTSSTTTNEIYFQRKVYEEEQVDDTTEYI